MNYVTPTGPETCEVNFDWYLDLDVYENMSVEERAKVIAENLKNR